MRTLLEELQRRNVLRVAAAYVVTSWLLIQVAETVFPLFGLGDEPARITVVVLVVLFLPVLVLAWVFELTPEGIRLDREVEQDRPTDPGRGRLFDRVIIVVLALAVGYFAIDKFVLAGSRESSLPSAASGPVASTANALPTVAVLPFTALTEDADSAFFAAGIHEDLMTQLTRLGSLRVISRSAVEEYRGASRPIGEIGRELGATAIFEGRIQAAGGRIRINASLIDAANEENRWADAFDRELSATNLFDVQAEIARAIAASLDATLTADEQAELSLLPTDNMAAYRAYHEAIAARDRNWRDADGFRALLRKAVELDPTFTRPWAELVGSLALSGFGDPDPDPALLAETEEAIERIRAVAPGSADHLIAQAFYTYYLLRDYGLAHQLVSRALELRPSDPRMMEVKAWIERRQGNYAAVVESLRASRSLDPRHPRWLFTLVNNLMLAHRYDEAEQELQQHTVPLGDDQGYDRLLLSYLALRTHGDFARYRSEIEALYAEYGDASVVSRLFKARVLDRDYAAALATTTEPDRARNLVGLTGRELRELQALWLLDDAERLRARVAELAGRFDEMDAAQEPTNGNLPLGAALLAAIAGDRAEAERLVRRWNREGAMDWPDRVAARHFSCHVLGIAGAADAAVECLRTGLTEPSLLAPFVDPYLPWFDPVRDTPAFTALIEELEAP